MKIGFIGGGNMAQALLGGIAARQPATRFVVVEPSAATRATVARLAPAAALLDAPSIDLASCDAVVFAVKPQVFRDAATQAARWLAGPLVISIAAGIRVREIARWLTDPENASSARRATDQPIVRAMPNTPALIGAGITGLYAVPAVDRREREVAETLLSAVGETLWVDDEAQLDVVTAVSGSGPAYVFSFIEALQQGATDLGLSPEDARRLAIATFTGASRLAAESLEPVSVLRERVTSKGGTTFAALTHLKEAGCNAAIVAAIGKAAARSAEMGEEFGKDGAG